MPHRKSISLTVLIALVFIAILTIPFTQTVKAQVSTDTTSDNDRCIQCHEDLYFLHDTGKWYCIRESPMTCTGCHDGNGSTIRKEEAHTNRAAHPVINEDVSKCQQCHPEQCDERVQIFKEEAGIPFILVAAPFLPEVQVEEEAILTAQVDAKRPSDSWVNLWEIIPSVLVVGAALTIYAVYRFRHRVK